MNTSPFIIIGAVLAFFAVMLGAFGAHALKSHLSTHYLTIYQIATDYHMWHAIGLIMIGILHQQNPTHVLRKAGWFMFVGLLIFSGSLYALSLTGVKALGAITPFGGTALLIAWLLLAYNAFKSN